MRWRRRSTSVLSPSRSTWWQPTPTLQTRHADADEPLARRRDERRGRAPGVAQEMAELSTAKEELFALDNKAQLSAQRAEHYQDESAMLVTRAEHAREESEGLARRAAQDAESLSPVESQVALFDEEAEARSVRWRRWSRPARRPGPSWRRRAGRLDQAMAAQPLRGRDRPLEVGHRIRACAREGSRRIA